MKIRKKQLYNDQKTATRHGSLFFDKYQVISEMQENKSAPKITPIVKMYSFSNGIGNGLFVTKHWCSLNNEVIIETAIPLSFEVQVHISSSDFLQ
jgi:hypothetical protein